jgi:hypothetical protein
MSHCIELDARPRRADILTAIGEHDNGWAEEDAAPIVVATTGEVADFVNAPLDVRHRVWPRAVQRLSANPWAATLVAQHSITVYDRFRSDPAWTPFFASMEAMRDALVRDSGSSGADLAEDYAFVRLGDLISLAFCTRWTDQLRFGVWTIQRSGEQVDVRPDPFGGRDVPIEIGARIVPGRRFRSDAALRDALRDAHVTTLRGSVRGH